MTNHEGQEERLRCKTFKHTQESPPTEHTLVFLRWVSFLQESVVKATVSLICPYYIYTYIYTDIDENQIPTPYNGVW